MFDWFDWMMPEAWNVEHNNRHHYCLSEIDDPDLVENNLKFLRSLPIPIFMKWPTLPFITTTWKWFYYAPNTYKELKLARWRKAGKKIPDGLIPTKAVNICKHCCSLVVPHSTPSSGVDSVLVSVVNQFNVCLRVK